MRSSLLLLSFASVTLLACATGATLDGVGGAGSGGAAGVTVGNTSSKSSANATTNATVTSAESSTNAATTTVGSTSQASTTVGSTTVSSTSQASTTVASTSVASSAMSSTGSGVVNCNPESPAAGCGAAQHCVPTDTNMPFCDVAGSGVQWDNCLGRDECGPTLECIDDGITCCAKWCTSDSDCQTAFGEYCAFAFVPPLLANGISYGVCYDSLGCL